METQWYCVKLKLKAAHPACASMINRVHPLETPSFMVRWTDNGVIVYRLPLIPHECLECVKERFGNSSLRTIRRLRKRQGINNLIST